MSESRQGTERQAARRAGLRYMLDEVAGISRKRAGSGFTYVDPRGKRVTDQKTLGRIRALAIPPAWRDVWICPDANGHLQATGRDQKGRKQYRYHARWRCERESSKYDRVLEFGHLLPKIRQVARRDLNRPGLGRRKVLAAVVRLLDLSLIRVGNDEYARNNHSFGLTTMQDRHVAFDGPVIRFRFRGKHGIGHEIEVKDPKLSKIVRACQRVPGDELFQYIDADGKIHDVTSHEVNAYLREITGGDYTAKDFRTWAGTVLASMALQEFSTFDSTAQAKRNILNAIRRVADQLGNTPTVCRQCYVHPAVVEAYLDGSLRAVLKDRTQQQMERSLGKLKPAEATVLALLRNRLGQRRAAQRRGA